MHLHVRIFHLFSLLAFLTGIVFAAPAKGGPKVIPLDAVVVTSEKIQEYVKNHPQDVKIVERREIVERNLSNVEDILKTISGVEVYSTSGIGSRISIRGSGRSSGVLVLLNGRPLNSNQYGSQDLNSIPVDSIQSVAVFKPPVPVWLGPGGSDGVINIVTSTNTTRIDKQKTSSTVKVEGGSYGFAEGSLSHLFTGEGGNALLSATTTHRDGSRTNSDRTSEAVAINWDRDQKDGSRYQASGRWYHAEYGSPGPLDNLTPNARQDYQKISVDTKYKGTLSDTGTLDAIFYGDLVTLDDKSQSGRTYTLDDQKIGIKLDTVWSQEDGKGDLRLGGMSEWDQFDHTLAGKHHRFRNGLNGQYDRRLGDFTPTIGLRADLTDDFGFNPGALAGVGWGVSKQCLIKAKAGYTVNIPTFEQLYQAIHGSIDQTRGNPDLNEERVWSSDIGVEYTFAKDRLVQLTLFRVDTSDLISYERGADLIYRPVNIAGAYRQGLEITGKYAWAAGLTTETSLTLQESENKDTGKDLPYTPAVKIKETLRYTLPVQKTRMEATIRYEGSRYSQMENLPAQRLDDSIVVDIKVTQPFTMGGIATDGYLKVNNLFNTSYQSHLGYPADGFVLIAGLQMKF